MAIDKRTRVVFYVLATLEKIGAAPMGTKPEEFEAFMRAEVTKWEPVLKAAE